MRHHAQRLGRFLFPNGYEGEFFLCGGAFKPLIRKELLINDLDLWVRNRVEREKLCAALIARGATLLRDFHPYCMKLRLDGQIVEITYHNVEDGNLQDILNTFDLAICGLGARYHNGQIDEICISNECWDTLQHREMHVLESYYCLLLEQKHPSLLRTLHRMGQTANELQYEVHLESEHRLWDLYWNTYTEEERQRSRDLYFATIVTHQTHHHQEHLVRRAAASGYAPIPHFEQRDSLPLQLAFQAA
ncbi:hypothetical protein FEM03_24035 [Phragmitibacter flavus]|uniref:Uncharacterized protein n=2 Tax=Phragmitibacter flavus TaxID=2576071 RepID=A0A5R8K741_9BACT|nr:hypothetical protein FEM03_24035 [Phragmitibacter flavus]